MHLYLGLLAWGVAAFVIYKAINVVLVKREIAGKFLMSGYHVDGSGMGCFQENLH